MSVPLRVCIVDDDFLFTDMLPRLLRRSIVSPELVFVTVRSPADARELLSKESFDVILSDFDLKTQETGLDVLRHAQKAAPGMLRILISGHLPHEIPVSEAPPYDVFVPKPMTLREMVQPLLTEISQRRGIAFQTS